MTKRNEIYKCKDCNYMVEVVIEGDCTPECCGKPMRLLKENDTDGAKEKHVPVVEKTADGYRVTVGEVEHPMTEAHYIQWIELITEDGVLRKHLTPNDKPVAEFKTDAKKIYAREYCNLHGLWRS
ncbi:desulfoferrodoxin [Prevotella sp. oral taxon 376]|uniref:desulfoferrodoxin n=1 Tax=Prevotella sp. oral taxon 376 TaxID=712466 RepID=UPI000D1DC37E|nr:desulfoferrodoxin [Prevotella sp. oral taxon 376]PTL33171.1 desulfoferrodoxin [Prevotella sp. oral taxon 376]